MGQKQIEYSHVKQRTIPTKRKEKEEKAGKMTLITSWILVFQLLTTGGTNAMSAVSPFDTRELCIAHAEYLFSDFRMMQAPEENYYHLLDSVINYMEFGNGEWVASWSCVPNIPYEIK